MLSRRGGVLGLVVQRPPPPLTLSPLAGTVRVYDSSVSSCSSPEALPTKTSSATAAAAPGTTDVLWAKHSLR